MENLDIDDNFSITIEQIPVEVLSMIFDHLDYKSLKRATLVCSLWNEIISTSKKFPARTKFQMEMIDEPFVMKTSRKYQHIRIDSKDYKDSRYLEIQFIHQLSQLKDYLKSLSISRLTVESQKNLIDFLRSCVHLEELKFFDVKVLESDPVNQIETLNLPKLRSLWNYDSFWFLDFMGSNRLEELKLSTNTVVSYRFHHDRRPKLNKVACYLNRLTGVYKLSLISFDLEFYTNFNLKFKWTKLDLYNSGAVRNIPNLKNLLKCAKPDSILILDSSGFPDLPNNRLLRVFDAISEERNITDIDVSIHTLKTVSKEPEFYEGLRVMPWITTLKLRARWDCQVVEDDRILRFTSKCPNVETFHMQSDLPYKMVPFSLPLLRVLHLERYSLDDMSHFAAHNQLEVIKVRNYKFEPYFTDECMQMFSQICEHAPPSVKQVEYSNRDRIVYTRAVKRKNSKKTVEF